jgi:hypothetical protein
MREEHRMKTRFHRASFFWPAITPDRLLVLDRQGKVERVVKAFPIAVGFHFGT